MVGSALSRLSTSIEAAETGEMEILPLTGMIRRVVCRPCWPSFMLKEQAFGSVSEDFKFMSSADFGGEMARSWSLAVARRTSMWAAVT